MKRRKRNAAQLRRGSGETDLGELLYETGESLWQSPKSTLVVLLAGLGAAPVLFAALQPFPLSIMIAALSMVIVVATLLWWRRALSSVTARVYDRGLWLAREGGQAVAFSDVERIFRRTDRHGVGGWNAERFLFVELVGGASVAVGRDLSHAEAFQAAILAALAVARPDLAVEEGTRYPA